MSLNARAVAAWAAAALFVAVGTANPVYRGLVLAAAVASLMTRRRQGARLRSVMVPVGVAAAASIVLNTLLSHGGDDVLLGVPDWIPGVGGPVTLEAIAFGVNIAAGLAAAALAAAALSLAVEPHDLVDALPAALAQTAAAVGGALNLVPAMSRSFGAVREAQRMRGWTPRGPRSWAQVMVPAVLTSVESSVQLAESMEARGFGSGRRTSYRPAAWRGEDVAVTVAAGFAVLIVFAARRFGYAGDWYPYPALSMPPADAAGLLACLLLFVPAIPWRR